MSKWDIITVSFNNSKQLKRNWNWMLDVGVSDSINWIVVDNNSKDDSIEIARELGATVIALSSNVGFSKANNIAFKKSNGEFVLFANPDLRVEANDLPKLATTIEKFPGICSPQLVNEDGSWQKNGRGLPFLSAKLAHRGVPLLGMLKGSKQYLPEIRVDKVYDVEWLMGASIACSRKVFSSIGLWDESFFIYYEDHELGLRSRKKGFSVKVDSRFSWKHEWARETKGFNCAAWKHEIKSAFEFYRRNLKYLR